KQIFEPEKGSLFGENYDSLIDFKKELVDVKVTSYNYLLSNIESKTIDSRTNVKNLLNLLIDLFEFSFIKIHLHLLRDNDLIITTKEIDKEIFLQICYATYIVVEKNTIPIELNDLVIGVKNKLKKVSFTKNDIEKACEVIDAIAIDKERKYSISFDKLSSASDMAFRILFEENQNMKLAEILKQINFRILKSDKKRVTKISLNQQMNMDSRLVPLGKSGFWT